MKRTKATQGLIHYGMIFFSSPTLMTRVARIPLEVTVSFSDLHDLLSKFSVALMGWKSEIVALVKQSRCARHW
jgi:hypothetical protein